MTSFYTRINVRIDMLRVEQSLTRGAIFFTAVHLRARAQVAHAHVDLFPMSILIHRWSVSFICLLG